MKQTDSELLMAAARAYWAGEIDDVVSIEWSEADDGVLYTHADNQDHNGHDRTYRWNPLQERADAFDLQVKLKMTVNPYTEGVFVSRNEDEIVVAERFDAPGCNGEATQRAIVRFAASLAA